MNRTTARKPAVAVPVIIFDDGLADDMHAERRNDGLLRLNPLLDPWGAAEAVYESILAMNGIRTPRTIPEGFEERRDGTVRPRLAVHEGGGQPDQRRTRRPQLTAIPDEGESR